MRDRERTAAESLAGRGPWLTKPAASDDGLLVLLLIELLAPASASPIKSSWTDPTHRESPRDHAPNTLCDLSNSRYVA